MFAYVCIPCSRPPRACPLPMRYDTLSFSTRASGVGSSVALVEGLGKFTVSGNSVRGSKGPVLLHLALVIYIHTEIFILAYPSLRLKVRRVANSSFRTTVVFPFPLPIRVTSDVSASKNMIFGNIVWRGPVRGSFRRIFKGDEPLYLVLRGSRRPVSCGRAKREPRDHVLVAVALIQRQGLIRK